MGFVETGTENEQVFTLFLQALCDRGLDSSQGLLVIIDGGKGLRAAVQQAFRASVLVQRCQWHKRENVVKHLPKGKQAAWRSRLQWAYQRPTYAEARAGLHWLQRDLETRNQSAVRSLAEGLEERLTLHRLGAFALLGASLNPQLSGVDQCLGGRAVCQGGSLGKLESASALVCHRLAGYRAAAPQSEGLSAFDPLARSTATRIKH